MFSLSSYRLNATPQNTMPPSDISIYDSKIDYILSLLEKKRVGLDEVPSLSVGGEDTNGGGSETTTMCV